MRAAVVGARRTAEELGRAFPGVLVRTSGGDHVPDKPALIVSTPGAEPVAEGGYSAALLLDTWLLLARPDLRAPEEAVRRWFNAAALVRPGRDVDWLSRGDLSRLRRRLAGIDPAVLAASTRRRALVEHGRALPEYVDRVVSAEGIVRTGVSAAAEAGADLVSTGEADLYSAPSLRSSLIARYRIDLASSNPNITLRTPAGEGLPVLIDRTVMPAAVVALDLFDSLEPRTHRAGREVLVQLIEQAANS